MPEASPTPDHDAPDAHAPRRDPTDGIGRRVSQIRGVRGPGEAVIVLSGRLDIYVGFERYELGPGDSMHFPSSRPHRYVNPTDAETRAVTVIRHDAGGA